MKKIFVLLVVLFTSINLFAQENLSPLEQLNDDDYAKYAYIKALYGSGEITRDVLAYSTIAYGIGVGAVSNNWYFGGTMIALGGLFLAISYDYKNIIKSIENGEQKPDYYIDELTSAYNTSKYIIGVSGGALGISLLSIGINYGNIETALSGAWFTLLYGSLLFTESPAAIFKDTINKREYKVSLIPNLRQISSNNILNQQINNYYGAGVNLRF